MDPSHRGTERVADPVAGDGSADGPVDVSVVLPAYNEAGTIEETVATTIAALSAFLPAGSFEVLIAEDGCDDETPEISDQLADDDDRVRHVHSDDRLGRGRALERAFDAAAGETLVYFDTDLATDMRHLEELVETVRSGDADVATGSRWIQGEEADRPAKRGVPSRAYNFMVRLLLRSGLQDHQCGFKALSREAFEELAPAVEDGHWFWDTELLVRAQKEGYEVREFPVDWTPKGDSKVDLLRDVLGMGGQLLRTWWQLFVTPKFTRPVRIASGVALTVAVLGLLTFYLDPSEVGAALSRSDPAVLALATGVYGLSWILRGLRYRTILRKLGFPERLDVLTGAVFISQMGNLVFPARAGDAVRAYIVNKRRDIPYTSGFASLAVERVFDLLTITALAGGVLLAVVGTGGATTITSALAEADRAGQTALLAAGAIAALTSVATASIVLTARSDRNLVRDVVSRLSTDSYANGVSRVLERFVGDVQHVTNSRLTFGRIGMTSVVIWTIDVLTAVVVLAAMGVDVVRPSLVAVAFLAVSIGNLAKVLPLSPGGIGLYEAAFTLLVVALTPITGPVAFAVAVLDHAVKNAVTIVGGVISMGSLNVSLTRAADEGGEVRSALPDDDVSKGD